MKKLIFSILMMILASSVSAREFKPVLTLDQPGTPPYVYALMQGDTVIDDNILASDVLVGNKGTINLLQYKDLIQDGDVELTLIAYDMFGEHSAASDPSNVVRKGQPESPQNGLIQSQ